MTLYESSVESRIANAKDDSEALNIIAELLWEHSERLAPIVRKLDAEAANGIQTYFRKRQKNTNIAVEAARPKRGETKTETTYNEIIWKSFHSRFGEKNSDGFCEYAYLVTLYRIINEILDESNERTQDDLRAVAFALAARVYFLWNADCKNMIEGFARHQNDVKKTDKQN